jgi:hypothetical protein
VIVHFVDIDGIVDHHCLNYTAISDITKKNKHHNDIYQHFSSGKQQKIYTNNAL